MPVCDNGWDSFEWSCYKISSTKRTFAAASTFCQSLDNSKLVALETTGEMDFVQNLVTANANSGNFCVCTLSATPTKDRCIPFTQWTYYRCKYYMTSKV